MADEFDLENNINQFGIFAEQIRLISRSFLNGQLNEDNLTNALEGLAVLIELHENKTFDSFKSALKLDEYSKIRP